MGQVLQGGVPQAARAAGGDRRLREEKRRRRIRERIGIGLSALFVGGMTLIFYLVLR